MMQYKDDTLKYALLFILAFVVTFTTLAVYDELKKPSIDQRVSALEAQCGGADTAKPS